LQKQQQSKIVCLPVNIKEVPVLPKDP